ncbi:MAG: type III secretion T3S chaperone [Chlamydiota bacterium]|jgi:hypothetical protein
MSADYPLQELVEIKERRFQEAARILEKKKKQLLEEEEKLKEKERERDKVLKHKLEKLHQLRQALDQGERTDKIQQMKRYKEVVDERLAEKEKQVDAQKKQVRLAEEQVEAAKKDLYQKQKDVEKLTTHKKEWMSEMEKEETRKEAAEQDEIGAALYSRKNKKKKSS